MNNGISWLRSKEKLKYFKTLKIKSLKLNQHILSEKNYRKKYTNYLKDYSKYFHKQLFLKYNTLPKDYSMFLIDNFINAKYCHSLSSFKDSLLFNYFSEFLNKFYYKKESLKKISLFAEFYKVYLRFFCCPTLKDLKLNELIEEMVEVKAISFYKKNFNDEKENKKEKNPNESKKYINILFFTNKIRKDISRKNTLTDLSKTTIEFNSYNKKFDDASTKSINSLIKEMEKNKRKNKIINKEIQKKKSYIYTTRESIDYNLDKNKNNKNILMYSTTNITPREEYFSLNIKAPEIKLNLKNNKITTCINSTKTLCNNIRYIKNSGSNTNYKFKLIPSINKPLYNKINIINNKVITNYNSRSKVNISKPVPRKQNKTKIVKEKNKLTLFYRNYNNNNNFFSSFNNVLSGINETQNKSYKTTNNNTKKSSNNKTKIHKLSLNKNNSVKKKNSKISHIKIIKEKNLILRPEKLKINNNLLSNCLRSCITERNNSKEDKKQRLTNFQMFSNNIININKIHNMKLISSDKESFKNLHSIHSISNKNSNSKNILNKNTYNTIENIRKIVNKSKDTSKKKLSSRSKIKSNLKIEANISNNKNRLSKKSFK